MDPRKLSRQQAHWSLFLQDFDIRWQVTPGTWMAPADALFRKDLINATDNNADATIVPDPVVIQALDLTLAHHIKSSSFSDPLILKVIQAIQDGAPLFSHSALTNWTFEDGHLYSPPDMWDIFTPKPLLNMTSGGLASPSLSCWIMNPIPTLCLEKHSFQP